MEIDRWDGGLTTEEATVESTRVIRILYKLGVFYSQNGDTERAVSTLERALEIGETRQKDNFHVGLIHHSLGHTFDDLGRPSDAEFQYRLALRNLETHCGNDNEILLRHTDAGILHYRLGCLFHQLGLLSQAQSSYRLALKGFKSRYGDDHEGVADILNDFGITKNEQGQHLNAIALFERALEIYERKLGNMNRGIAHVLNNLGNALNDVCEPAAAIEKYTRAVEIYQNSGDDVAVGKTLRNIGIAYETMGQFGHAEYLFWEAMKRFGTAYLEDIIDTLSNVADSYAARRNYPEAIRYFQFCIDAKRKSPSLVDFADELNEIGYCYASMGMLDEACEACQSALTFYVATHGWLHLTVANTFNNLGNAHLIAHAYDLALKNFKTALGITQALPNERPVTEAMADLVHNIGLSYHFQGRRDDSIKMLEEAVRYYERLYGHGHVKTAESINMLGANLSDQGFHEKAIEQFKRAIQLYRDAYGECYIRIADIFTDYLGMAYTIQGKYEDAVEVLEEGSKIYETSLGVGHEHTSDALYQLTVALYRSGRIFRARETGRRVRAVWEVYATYHLTTEYGKWIVALAQSEVLSD